MIYVTGDIHGSIDIRKLMENDITKQMTEDDFLIICGDFGLVWNYKKEDRKERKWLKWLNDQRWTTLFADGNHECFPRLNSFPVKEWHGGHVHELRPKVLHLMRGEVFEIEGQTIFVMGGASSHDRGPAVGDTKAVIGKFWWPEELPSEEEMRRGFANLARYDNKVDYIISHCLPSGLQYVLKKGTYQADSVTFFHEAVFNCVEFKHWYCGHYHYNIDTDPRVTVIFSRIIRIGQTIAESETMIGVPKFMKHDTVLINYNEEILLGKIKSVMPYGTLFKHDEPYYDIDLYDQSRDKTTVTIKETQIIEKSLAEF